MKKLCKNCKYRLIKIDRKTQFEYFPCDNEKSVSYNKDTYEYSICDYWEAKVIGNGE